MKIKISFLALVLAVVAMFSFMTACQSSDDEDWRIVHPLEDAAKIKFSLSRKTDIMDYSPMNPAPQEITFNLNMLNTGDQRIEQLHGILTVSDANGGFLCVINTPSQGVTIDDQWGDGYCAMTVKGNDIPAATMNELLCTHPSELKLTFEITNVSFRQYDEYGEYQLVHATEFPPKQTVENKIEDLDWNSSQKDFRLAAKIYMNGGYEQALGLFENMSLVNASKYHWEGQVPLYIDKCHEVLGK